MLHDIDIEKKLTALLPELISRFKVRKIGLFGSFVKGTANQESDVDILVEFHETPGWEYFDLQEFLEKHLERKVDLVTPNALKQPLRSKILDQVKFMA